MTNLGRWNPFKFRRKTQTEKQSAPNESTQLAPPPMRQIVESFFHDALHGDPFPRFGDFDRWFGDFSAAHFRPTIDVIDKEAALEVSAELPGMTKDDVHLEVHDNILTIKGEKKNESEKNENGCYRVERTYGMFARSIPLPSDVDPDGAEATFDKGVLRVNLPKAAKQESKGKSIAIK